MKRAILVSTGTLAGLAAVLSYSGAENSVAIAAGPADSSSGLGAPPPITSTDPTTAPPSDAPASDVPAATPTPSASASGPDSSVSAMC